MLLSISSQSKQTEEPSAQTVTYIPFHEKVLRCPKQSVCNRCLCSCNEGNSIPVSCIQKYSKQQATGIVLCSQLSLITPCLFVFHMFHQLYSETVLLELFLVFIDFFFLHFFFFFSFKTLTTAITPAKPLNKRSSFTQGALEKMVLN